MENTKSPDARIRARDRALSLLNRLTAGIAFAAVAGVGVFGAVSAMTIPGVSASSATAGATTATGTATSSSTSSTSTSSSSSVSSSGLQASSGTVSSSSGSGVAVSGGS